MTQPRSYRWLVYTLAIVGLTADLGSKYGVFKWLYHDGQPVKQGELEAWTECDPWGKDNQTYIFGGRYNLIPGWFGFQAEYQNKKVPEGWAEGLQTYSAPLKPYVNYGALFGLGVDHKEVANRVFACLSVLAACGIIYWITRKTTTADIWLCVALGLILGGTLGNLFDRIVFGGVRDFLYFYIIDWPVFNVADCGLVCGAGLLLAQALFTKAPAKAPVVTPAAAVLPVATNT